MLVIAMLVGYSQQLVVNDTILERDFCQRYWAGEMDACATLRAKIVANHSVSGRHLPTHVSWKSAICTIRPCATAPMDPII